MPATFTLYTDPIGSQLVRSIGADDPDDLNDFDVYILANESVTNFQQSSISVPSGNSIQSLEGSGAVYKAVVRPQTSAGTIDFVISEDAVDEENSETTKTIRLSTSFPDTDAESATQLIGVNYSGVQGIAVTPTRIYVSRSQRLYAFTHDGTEQTSEELTLTAAHDRTLDYFNGSLISSIDNASEIHRFSPINDTRFLSYPVSGSVGTVVHTRLGLLGFRSSSFWVLPYDYEDANSAYQIDFPSDLPASTTGRRIAHQNDLLYLFFNGSGSGFIGLARITDDDSISFVKRLNIDTELGQAGRVRDIAIYGDTLYILRSPSTQLAVHTLDIKKYRPLAKNTKTRIDVQFIDEGGTLDMTQFSPDAERIIFDTGFDKPDYLSINSSNELEVAASAVTETTPVLVPLRGINRVDSQPFSFYLIVRQAAAPVWRDVETLTMRADSSFDLHQIVDADSIAGQSLPTGGSVANGIFTIGTTGGNATFRATKGTLTTDKTIQINVIQAANPDNFSDIVRYKVEIAGIDVTADILKDPPIQVSKSLDDVELTRYRPHAVKLSLKNNENRYTPDHAGNFWQTNTLNPGGYQEEIKIYRESLVNDVWVESLLFIGVIQGQVERISAVQVNITANDISVELERAFISDFGTLEKWDNLRQQSDEANIEGVYVPEGSLLPVQPQVAKAWSDRTALTLRRLQLPTQGPPLANTGYLTASDFRTSGGFLQTPPVLEFKTLPRSEDVTFLVNQLALTESIYNTDIQLPEVVLDDPTLFNRGSVPFSVENTRMTRLIRDWVYDSTNDRILMLLSNPERHIADQLVQYNIARYNFRTLYTFDKDIKVHRIERRNSTNYYILTSPGITQDLSAANLPRTVDKTAYAFDSAAEGSLVRIHHYNASTNALTEHVAEDNARPSQLGIFYPVGFENDYYIDEFEGIRPDDRGAFKWNGSHLYYRYAKDGEFGVARVNTGGTTAEMMSETDLGFQNHLNFAFDITSGGDIYFVYATGDAETSTLTIKQRTSGGTVSTLFSETRGVGDFNDLGIDFGAFLGCYETVFHDNQLYILAPIQKVDLGDDHRSIINPDVNIRQLTAEKTGERNVTTSTNLEPANLTLTPGDDIPLRIDFDGSVSGATQADLTVYGGTIQSFSISSDMIDVTIRPDSQTVHKNIIVDLAEDAVTETNEAWRITIDFETARSRRKSAGMVLYRVSTNTGNPTLEVVDKWDFVSRGGCNLVVHAGAVHFMEHPPASTAYTAYNPDLDSYNDAMGYNVLPEALGALKKIDSSGDVESLGNLWYAGDRPYNIALTPALSFNDELHITMGYGDPDAVLRYNSLASKADNFVHLILGNTLKYIPPAFEPSGTVYSQLVELARQVGATVSFDGKIISLVDRRPSRAKVDGATGTGTGNLDFDGENKTFPSSGYLRIGDEFVGYTGISSGAFTGITRGALGTLAANHADNASILFVNALFSERDILSITPSTDTTRHHNIVRDSNNIFEVSADDTNIAQYRKQPYTLDLGLTRNEVAWIETIFEEYLSELKTLGKVFDLKLRARKQSYALDLGQWIGLQFGGQIYVVRIEILSETARMIHIKGRSVATEL